MIKFRLAVAPLDKGGIDGIAGKFLTCYQSFWFISSYLLSILGGDWLPFYSTKSDLLLEFTWNSLSSKDYSKYSLAMYGLSGSFSDVVIVAFIADCLEGLPIDLTSSRFFVIALAVY